MTEVAPEVRFTDSDLSVRFDRFHIPAYELFLRVKRLPESKVAFDAEDESYTVTAPARFASLLGVERPARRGGELPLSEFLFDDQREIVRLALDAKRFACWSECGNGKGLLPECPVLTPEGFVPLKALTPGDWVIGADGLPTEVAAVFHRGVQPLYRVRFGDGIEVIFDADHLWSVKSYNDVSRGKPWRVLSTAHLASTQLKYGQHGQSRTWQVPLVQAVRFARRDLPIDPYLLGVLIGDGTIGGTVSWCKPDTDIAARIGGLLPSGVTLERSDQRDRATNWRIVGVGARNPVLDALRSLGLAGKRSWEKFVPASYLINDVPGRIALLQGLMDTDGYAGESPEFCSTSRPLADAVVHLVQSLGGTAAVGCREAPVYEHKGEKRTGRPAYRVNMTLPPGIQPFSLPRKARAFKTPSRGLGRWIDSIEPCGEGETICIKVGAPDGLFVIDRHIVTHNTLIGLEVGRQVVHRTGGKGLIVTLNDIVPEWIDQQTRFYGDALPLERLNSRAAMRAWCADAPSGLAVTNYEKWNPGKLEDQVVSEARRLSLVVVDENRLKTGGGKQKWAIIKSCKGIEYKLSLTATPAPNDVMEFASQASFLEKMRSQEEILWTYFTRDPKTHRWTVRPHARRAFFEFMASWSIYVRDPRRYGWRLNLPEVPKPEMIVHELSITDAQRDHLRELSAEPSGQQTFFDRADTNAIQRGKLSQVAKGFRYRRKDGKRVVQRIESVKPGFVAQLVKQEVADGRQVLVWTEFDAESELLSRQLATVARTITGATPRAARADILHAFRAGDFPVLISRARMLGWGVNLQNVGAMIFSGWSDSYESWYQAVRRAYRFGQLLRLRVHLPVIPELEGDMLENIFRKEAEHEAAIAEMEANYLRARGALAAGRVMEGLVQ